MATRRTPTARVFVLMPRADGFAGLPRAVLNMAGWLADDHQVEIISLFRTRDEPTFDIDPRIRVRYLVDARPVDDVAQPTVGPAGRLRRRVGGWLRSRPSRLVPSGVDAGMSLATDLTLWWSLRRLRSGVLISTHPALNDVAARFVHCSVVLVGQDHLNFPIRMRNPEMAALVRASAPRLACLVVLTRADASDYAELLGPGGPPVVTIPNALSWPAGEAAQLTNKVVVAAGRLEPQKGFARLIRAYAPVAHKHPDWELRIYGGGRLQPRLQRQIDASDLGEQVRLMGYTDDFVGSLEEAAVFALSSHSEGFPMVLLEAMSRGVPIVSFDCPRGPAELVVDGDNGRLVPDGDLTVFTEAMLQLIEDEPLRRRMGAAALTSAQPYEQSVIAARWDELLWSLTDRDSS